MSIAEMGSDVDVGRKRRLPVWMSGVGSSPVKSRISEDDEDPNVRSGLPSQALTFEEAKKSREDATVSEKVVVEDYKRKRPKRSSYRKHTTDVPGLVDLKKRGSKNHDGMDETKSKMNDGTRRSKNRKFILRDANGKLIPSKPEEASDNEVQLTVEDLISIAQECVSAEAAREEGSGASTKGSKTKGMPSTSSFPSKSNSTESYGDGQAGTRTSISSKCTKVASLSDQAGQAGTRTSISSKCTKVASLSGQAEEAIPSDMPRIGDAAQDMLDVFLGPLLQKVDVREGKQDILTMDDLISSSDSKNKPARNEADQKVEVPLEKKKTSLKDKVAMFLD